MSTSFDTIFTVFFDKIQADSDFFSYYNLSNEEALELAKSRAEGYLIESIVRLTLKITPEIDFRDYNLTTKVIIADLNDIEIDLLANLMFEMYLAKDIARLKAYEVNFTPTDLQVFSPSQSRKSFMDMYKDIREENKVLLADYASYDRLTGKRKVIDYSLYSEE
jgi:hypothetical protein